MPSSSSIWKLLVVCGMLFLGVCAVFGQTAHHGFAEFDDPEYVYHNPFVLSGLTFRGVLWALLRFHASNWHPLTWISHMLDCQWFGLEAGRHHITNFVLHGISACLLFVLLLRLSGAFCASAFVAAMFAVHPLRVESVAWIAERKDILSGLFFFLTLLAYERYVRRGQTVRGYLLTTVLFIMGLMTKPMLVTLPFIALLLDYWPLGRFRAVKSLPEQEYGGEKSDGDQPADAERAESNQQSSRSAVWLLLLEKTPWLVLSAVSCGVTIMAQQRAIVSGQRMPLILRLCNVFISYTSYLWMTVWPHDLAVYYPLSLKQPSLPSWLGASIALAVMTTISYWLRKGRPYLLVGWLWYLLMLLPVIGLVQVGGQALADRYTYLSQIGIFIAVTWSARDIVRHWPQFRASIAAIATLVLTLSLLSSWRQTDFWRNDLSLWSRTVHCTPENALALNNLALALADAGHKARADNDLQRAGDLQAETEQTLLHAIELQPRFPMAYFNLGMELEARGKTQEALHYFAKAMELEPEWAQPHNEYARLLAGLHRRREAIDHLETAVKLDPNALVVQENLAWMLATTDPAEGGDPQRAVALAEGICRALPSPGIYDLDVLAASYAATGRFSDAAPLANYARSMALSAGRNDLVSMIELRLKLYQEKKPYRE